MSADAGPHRPTHAPVFGRALGDPDPRVVRTGDLDEGNEILRPAPEAHEPSAPQYGPNRRRYGLEAGPAE